jgi:peptidoglycan/xylan/chitin deacetylase (PgdA/CDA1 family)
VRKHALIRAHRYFSARISITNQYGSFDPKGETMPICYLTFDDGPAPQTAGILGLLKKLNVPATFFLNGPDLADSFSIIQTMVQDGHALGNHGIDHNPFLNSQYRRSNPAEVKKDFEDNIKAYKKLFSKRDKAFQGFTCARLPGNGSFIDKYVTMISEDLQVPHVSWDSEFSHDGITTLKHLRYKNWQGIPKIISATQSFPLGNTVTLLHDKHWPQSKLPLLSALIKKLQTKFVFKTLKQVPVHKSIRQAVQ